jgi:hypothetical protein
MAKYDKYYYKSKFYTPSLEDILNQDIIYKALVKTRERMTDLKFFPDSVNFTAMYLNNIANQGVQHKSLHVLRRREFWHPNGRPSLNLPQPYRDAFQKAYDMAQDPINLNEVKELLNELSKPEQEMKILENTVNILAENFEKEIANGNL